MSRAKLAVSTTDNLSSKSKSLEKVWKKPVSTWPKRLFPDMPINRFMMGPKQK